MAYREELWQGTDPQGKETYISFVVQETGLDTEPTGIIEVSYELMTDLLVSLGFQKSLDMPHSL